jgi:hypothetical protein
MLYCLNINTLQHLYIDILILMIKIKPSNLLQNLRIIFLNSQIA